MTYLACVTVLRHKPLDIIVCDLVAHVLPLLRTLSSARLVFYCHFPDLLLTPPRRGWYQRYRTLLDRLESTAVEKADRLLVNSCFTAEVFRKTFPRCSLTPEVVYPGVDCARYVETAMLPNSAREISFLSINRYERKKNVALALEALAALRTQLEPSLFAKVRLVIAGGYDERFLDNRDTLSFLQSRSQDLGLIQQVRFFQSLRTQELLVLLAQCRAVVYTPENEHFGYGPVEAMAAGRPVIAVNSGGPRETIRHGETGFLCQPTPESFAEAFRRLVVEPVEAERMGQAGRAHVVRSFSLAAFGERLNQIINDVATSARASAPREC
jgi:alpha-1,3/alpha-1,6-mannosyltransferase